MLAQGNTKLGSLVSSFSIPTVETCPGATPLCLAICYAMRGHYLSEHVKGRLARNLARTRRADFATQMTAEIRRSLPAVVRIHAAGDFYDAEYTGKWATIARTCPRPVFFAYTRSWRAPAILPALLDLASIANVHLWWSEDRDTGPSPHVPGIRTCFLIKDRSDEVLVDPARHDLVFRDAAHRRIALFPGPLKDVHKVRVCPYDQWYRWRPDMVTRKEPPRFTCSSCRICFTHGASV